MRFHRLIVPALTCRGRRRRGTAAAARRQTACGKAMRRACGRGEGDRRGSRRAPLMAQKKGEAGGGLAAAAVERAVAPAPVCLVLERPQV